jgi:guanosine-3',5'-bis(diphosphate) 3'-pyrophosphohydrolase
MGALLHDTVEDTQTTFGEIETFFGSTVCSYVREVTDDKSLSKQMRKQLQIEHAPHKSLGAASIKLGDKLFNLKSLLTNTPVGWEKERIDGYFTWAKSVVDALPPANASLKQEVDATIAQYWANQQ